MDFAGRNKLTALSAHSGRLVVVVVLVVGCDQNNRAFARIAGVRN